jgi:hypothetical protein
MEEQLNENFIVYEPLKTNRWTIEIEGMDIPNYLFRKFKLYNVGNEMIFKTEFHETINFDYNPVNLFNIVGIKVKYLDITGEQVGGFQFDVKGTNFVKKCSYGEDDLMITKLRFTAKTETLKKLVTVV